MDKDLAVHRLMLKGFISELPDADRIAVEQAIAEIQATLNKYDSRISTIALSYLAFDIAKS